MRVISSMINDRRIVTIPPTAVQVEIPKLVGYDRHFVLIHTGEKCGQELDTREILTELNENIYITWFHPTPKSALMGRTLSNFSAIASLCPAAKSKST
jgi:hypothetical protein